MTRLLEIPWKWYFGDFYATLWHVISRQIKKYSTRLWIPRKQQCFEEFFCLLVHARFYSHCDVRNFSRQIKKCRSWNSQYAMFWRFFCLFVPAKKFFIWILSKLSFDDFFPLQVLCWLWCVQQLVPWVLCWHQRDNGQKHDRVHMWRMS